MRTYADLGFKLFASEGTGTFLKEHGVEPEIIDYADVKPLIGEEIQIVINTPKTINKIGADSFPIRRAAIERGLPVHTCMDTARIFAVAIELKKKGTQLEYQVL